MCPDRHSLSFASPRAQRGFLLPVAMFIVVAMGLAAVALWRTTSQTSVASVQELITVQALYAAESGVQAGMSRLFYPDASRRTVADTRCSGLDESLDFSGISGLNTCRATVQCTVLESGIYTLSSDGECGSGGVSATRSLEVVVRF